MVFSRDKFTIFLLTVSALAISASAAFFSVYGLSKVFAGAGMAVIIMASILEGSKLITAYALHKNWDKLTALLKGYLTVAVIVLMVITSAGIYGFLSNAYQITANANSITEKEIAIVQAKVDNKTERLTTLIKEKESLVADMNSLRQGFSSGTSIESVDRRTGQRIISRDASITRSLNTQLTDATQRRNKIDLEIEQLSASVDSLKIEILERQSNNDAAAELGPIIYLSKITNVPMDILMNYFILMIVFVFDPLAVSLILALGHISSYDDKRRKSLENTTPELYEDEMLEELNLGEDEESNFLEDITDESELMLYDETKEVQEKKEQDQHEKLPKLKIKTIKKRVPEYKIVDNGQRVLDSKEVEEVVIESGDEEDDTNMPLSPEEYDKLVDKYINHLQQHKNTKN